MNFDDTHLTAYALGGLTDLDRIKMIEQAMFLNPDLVKEIADIRELNESLGSAFKEEEGPVFDKPEILYSDAGSHIGFEAPALQRNWMPWAAGMVATFAMVFVLVILGLKYSPENSDGGTSKYAVVELKDSYAQANPTSATAADISVYDMLDRLLKEGVLPENQSVNVGELVNYFAYNYPEVESKAEPLEMHVEQSSSPFNEGRRLLRVGIQAYSDHDYVNISKNLVFLVDVSSSMDSQKGLELLKHELLELAALLDPRDRMSIVTYAGASQVALPSTLLSDQLTIVQAIQSIEPSSANSGLGSLEEAYRIAEANRENPGGSKIIVCTDGDFNVGVRDNERLLGFIEKKSETGISLSVYGFGAGPEDRSMFEMFASNGKGKMAFVSASPDSRKVFRKQIAGVAPTVARDMNLQMVFNSRKVSECRLLGYEDIATGIIVPEFPEDVLAGQAFTAVYEWVPNIDFHGAPHVEGASVQYAALDATDLVRLNLSYELPNEHGKESIVLTVNEVDQDFEYASNDFRFATAVAGFGGLLNGAEHVSSIDYSWIMSTVNASGIVNNAERNDFIHLVSLADSIKGRNP